MTSHLDQLLASHGYEREAGYYRAVRPNHDTLVLFCHFGVGCVIISHLLGVSPMILWHGACAAPSSVTTLVTEERREGIAAFRMLSFGDTSHLYVAGEEPSFAARFCETYGDTEQRTGARATPIGPEHGQRHGSGRSTGNATDRAGMRATPQAEPGPGR